MGTVRSSNSLAVGRLSAAGLLLLLFGLAAVTPPPSSAQTIRTATASATARPSLPPFFATQTALSRGSSGPRFVSSATATRAPTSPAPGRTATPAAARPTPTRTPGAPAPSPSPLPPPFVVRPGALAGKTIAVDPGHGGRDPGAVHHGLHEAEVNLAIALELRPFLEAAGARVVLTRDGDRAVASSGGTDDDLQARVHIANAAEADLFLSIHSNAHSNDDIQGAMTFFGPEQGFVSGAQRTPRLVALSRQLAGAINRELIIATGQVDRGVRSASFWVLGGPRLPAVLVETGFLTNEDEARRLGSSGHQRRIAQGIAAGVARFLATAEDGRFVADVTVPDGATVMPGEPFLKTWRLRNTGATRWGPGYRLAFRGGDRVGGPASVPLPAPPVPPGGEVEVSVPLQANPEDAGHLLEGEWQLQNPNGFWFGDRIWVTLRAAGSAGSARATPRPLPPTPTPTPAPLPTDRAAPLAHPDATYVEAT
ncbi:MAG: N-acetylmuramoyl-L-alanine amidase, partial [Chloroflexota bacterium]